MHEKIQYSNSAPSSISCSFLHPSMPQNFNTFNFKTSLMFTEQIIPIMTFIIMIQGTLRILFSTFMACNKGASPGPGLLGLERTHARVGPISDKLLNQTLKPTLMYLIVIQRIYAIACVRVFAWLLFMDLFEKSSGFVLSLSEFYAVWECSKWNVTRFIAWMSYT